MSGMTRSLIAMFALLMLIVIFTMAIRDTFQMIDNNGGLKAIFERVWEGKPKLPPANP